MADEKMENQKAKVTTILSTMFEYLGLEGTFTVEEHPQKLAVKISSNDAGRIIGRKGQTLDSLQLLVNRIMFKDSEDCPRIMLDIDGYSSGERHGRSGGEGEGERPARPERRNSRGRGESSGSADQIAQQALDAAKEVKKWGEPVKMPEMNAHDRRIVHVTLQDDPEVTTESEGEGALKKVVISLKKAE